MVSAIESSRASDIGASCGLSLPGVGAVPSWEGSVLTPIAITGRQAHDSPSQESGRPKGGGGQISSDPANPPRASWEEGQLACGQDKAPGQPGRKAEAVRGASRRQGTMRL